MTADQVKQRQKAERDRRLQAILESKSKKKLIVAGAGTGKTYTFGQLLKQRTGGNNLAMTFIRKLVDDLGTKLGDHAEVKTFHAYCKKILHAKNGKVEIAPFLTKVIEKDAELLEQGLSNFDAAFQMLDEDGPKIPFHLKRGDYYDAVGFDDSVYRLYKMLQRDPEILPAFDQIVIDEFQDFHPLEVAFIHVLSKKGDILIVGDDDQAIYDGRNASPTHLRAIHQSADFEKFELPFCSRCPQVIISATNSILQRAQQTDHLQNRIPKRYECYLEDKEADSIKYPKIVLANCTVATVIAKYVHSEISKIDPRDIAESNAEGNEYPTVLIVGTRQYLQAVEKHLKNAGLRFDYTPSDEISYGIIEAYEWLLRDRKSNLGWRILAGLFFEEREQKRIVKDSETCAEIPKLLDAKFVANHLHAIELVRAIRSGEQALADVQAKLKSIVVAHFDEIIAHFSTPADAEEVVIDKTKPTILLTSFKGCKGLSAGHVFIVGVHNGSMPRDASAIKDVEISQFIVALTRTRKQCHIVSDRWLVAPVGRDKKPIPAFQKSTFISWIPTELVDNKGKIRANDLII